VSIVRAVIRQAAVAALLERTWAEARVFDSDNRPLIEALQPDGQGRPYIVVFTDADNHVDVTDGVYSSTRNLQLTLEMGVASAMLVKGSDNVQINFPNTDKAMELGLDILHAQAMAALFGDAQSAFGELIRDLSIKIIRITSPRGGRTEKGLRYAARQVTATLDVVSDPPPGVVFPETHPINRFLKMAQDKNIPGVVDASELLQSVLGHTTYPSWQVAQQWLGMRKAGIRSIGLAPLTDMAPGAALWGGEINADITATSGEGPTALKVTLDDQTTPNAADTDVVPPPEPPDPADPLDEAPHDSWPRFPPEDQKTLGD